MTEYELVAVVGGNVNKLRRRGSVPKRISGGGFYVKFGYMPSPVSSVRMYIKGAQLARRVDCGACRTLGLDFGRGTVSYRKYSSSTRLQDFRTQSIHPSMHSISITHPQPASPPHLVCVDVRNSVDMQTCDAVWAQRRLCQVPSRLPADGVDRVASELNLEQAKADGECEEGARDE